MQERGEWGQATENWGEGPCREKGAGGGVRGSTGIGVSSRERNYGHLKGVCGESEPKAEIFAGGLVQ